MEREASSKNVSPINHTFSYSSVQCMSPVPPHARSYARLWDKAIREMGKTSIEKTYTVYLGQLESSQALVMGCWVRSLVGKAGEASRRSDISAYCWRWHVWAVFEITSQSEWVGWVLVKSNPGKERPNDLGKDSGARGVPKNLEAEEALSLKQVYSFCSPKLRLDEIFCFHIS